MPAAEQILAGLTLIANRWQWLAVMALAYGVIGVLVLGVVIDVILIGAGLALAAGSLRERRENFRAAGKIPLTHSPP
jgi:hypothetical protein